MLLKHANNFVLYAVKVVSHVLKLVILMSLGVDETTV
uniref:Transcriptional regulator n=1 Tax=Heterorhabditis bacteriophora TaxID=37862 RepID=A0A1I7WWC9_HETBA